MSLKKDIETIRKDFNIEKYLFNGLLFTVIIVFPALLVFLTWKFWGQ